MITCLCATALWGCQRKGTSFVEMNLQGGEIQTVFLYEVSATQGSLLLDSIRLDARGHGKFPFPDDSARLYAIAGKGNANFLFLIPQPGEELQLQASYHSLAATASLQSRFPAQAHQPTEGPSPSQSLLEYQQKAERCLKGLDSIDKLWIANRYRASNTDSLYQACARLSDSLLSGLKREAKEICLQNRDNLTAVFVFNKMCGRHPLFNPLQREDWEFMHARCMEMQKAMPGNPHVDRLLFNLERIEAARRNAALQQEMGKRKGENDDAR